MKIVIESLVAVQRYKGDFDLRDAQRVLKGSRYQPDLFKGLLYDIADPPCKVFLMADRTIRIHGTRSMEATTRVSNDLIRDLKGSGIMIGPSGDPEIKEVVASHEIGSRIDPSKVLEIFKGERLSYDPRVLPGFVLRIPSTPLEVLIFPEGKIVARGGRTIEDAASTLQMVANKLGPARVGPPPPNKG